MSNVLVLTSSALGDDSVSTQLVNHTVAQIVGENPAATVVRRDLGTDPVPHLVFDSTAAIRGGAKENDAQVAALAFPTSSSPSSRRPTPSSSAHPCTISACRRR